MDEANELRSSLQLIGTVKSVIFQNEESETMNVLYRRHDGSYGLLQPDI